MKIKLFLVSCIDGSAVKHLASIIYSNALMHRFVTQVNIDEHGAEFVRPLFYNNVRIPFSWEGLECRNGILYDNSQTAGRPNLNWLTAAKAGEVGKFHSIEDAVRHLTYGYQTEVSVAL